MAEIYVNASPAYKALSFRLAETVRHIEQDLSSMVAINVGLTLLISGCAIKQNNAFTKWLGWAALVVGSCYILSGLFLNYLGFSQHLFRFCIGNLLLIWLLSMAVLLWREGNRTTR